MPSDLVVAFTRAMLARLVQEELLEIRPGRELAVVDFVSEELGTPGPGRQLLSTLSRALVQCPDVEELFADQDDLVRLVSEL
jgi:hypothetical protein